MLELKSKNVGKTTGFYLAFWGSVTDPPNFISYKDLQVKLASNVFSPAKFI